MSIILLSAFFIPLAFHAMGGLMVKMTGVSSPASPEPIQSALDDPPSFYFDKDVIQEVFDPDFAPLQILTVVHNNDSTYFDELAYLSILPNAIFNDSGINKISPIIYDSLDSGSRQFLASWAQYNNYFRDSPFGTPQDGLKRIFYVGNVSDPVRQEIQTIFNYPHEVNSELWPLNFTGATIFDLAANVADYFWFTSPRVIVALGNETLGNEGSETTFLAGTVNPYISQNITGVINSTISMLSYDSSDIKIQSELHFIRINNTAADLFGLELIGNASQPVSQQWVYDTNNRTSNDWVFFPNVTHPADSSDWALKVYNKTTFPGAQDFYYNLTFHNSTGSAHQILVENSSLDLQITVNDTNCRLWLLDPTGQFVDASNSTGSLMVKRPEAGTWTLYITALENETASLAYNVTMLKTFHSPEKEDVALSASNAAVIASLLHAPLLYVDKSSVPTGSVQQTLGRLKPAEIIFVEPRNSINQTRFNETLGLSTLSTLTSLENMSIITEYIYNISKESDVILTSLEDGHFAPAALMAARHGGVVLPASNHSTTFYQQAYRNYKLIESTQYQDPYSGAAPYYEDMVNLSATFHQWLSGVDIAQPTVPNRTVIIVSPISDVRLTLDRAIMGIDKSIVGRFSGETEINNSISICQSIFAPLFSYRDLSPMYDTLYIPTNQTGETVMGNYSALGTPEGTIDDTHQDDDIYYSWLNDSSGIIDVPFYFDLDNGTRDLNIDNDTISRITVEITAKINSTSNVSFAGVRLWNWTASDYDILDNSVYNSTFNQTFQFLIQKNQNVSDYIGNFTNQVNQLRVSLYFNSSLSSDSLNASIDFMRFNISYDKGPYSQQKVLLSSVSYWHDLNYGGSYHNYSSELPSLFESADYQVWNTTNYYNVLGNFTLGPALWYHSGYGETISTVAGEEGGINFLNLPLDNWRGFDDGKDVDDPLVSNPVNHSNTIIKYQSNIIADLAPDNLNTSIMLLNDDFLAATTLPETFMNLGTSAIVANYRENVLGYSEHVFYTLLQQALTNNESLGVSLALGLNETGRIYSQDWRNDFAEVTGLPSNSEDYHQFVLFGDPEQHIPDPAEDLRIPSNYKALYHGAFEQVRRKNNHFLSEIWVNITDVDGKIAPGYQDFSISLNGTVPTPEIILSANNYDYLDNFAESIDFLPGQFNGEHYAILIRAVMYTGERWEITNVTAPLGPIEYSWEFVETMDGHQDVQYYTENVTLISDTPEVSVGHSGTELYLRNETGYDEVSYLSNYQIARKNHTLNVTVVVYDKDHDKVIDNDAYEFNVTMHLKHRSENHWVNISMNLLDRIDTFTPDYYAGPPFDNWQAGTSQWVADYNFTEYDPDGVYDVWIDVQSHDEYGQQNISKALSGLANIGNVTVINWLPEVESFSMNFGNNTYFRVNETLFLNATFLDVDDFIGNVDTVIGIDGNESLVYQPVGNFEGLPEHTSVNDNDYHHEATNDSSGSIFMPYYINLEDYGFEENKIGGIMIRINAYINDTTNVTFAGWKIMNWTSMQPKLMSDSVFIYNISSGYTELGEFYGGDILDIIDETNNNRIEFYVQVNSTNQTVKASVDWIEVRVLNYNRTGVYAEVSLYNPDHNIWLTQTMKHLADVGGSMYNTSNWSWSHVFSPLDRAGNWTIFFSLKDREDDSTSYNMSTTINVVNHVPDRVDIWQPAENVSRLFNITFLANASDVDVYRRSANLTVNASLFCWANSLWYNVTMNFNSTSNSWFLNWTPYYNLETGNWSYYVTVEDEEGGINETSVYYNFTVLNNAPEIVILDRYPPGTDYHQGSMLTLDLNFTDLEGLKEYRIIVSDSKGKEYDSGLVSIVSDGNVSVRHIELRESDFVNLTYGTTWQVVVMLFDTADLNINSTLQFTAYAAYEPPPPWRIPWEIFIIFGIIIILVVGALLIYRYRRKEKPAVPVSKVKSIIKQLSEQRKEEDLREQKLIEEQAAKEKAKALKMPKKVVEAARPRKKIVKEAKPLSKLERKNLEVELSETLSEARFAVRKRNYQKAGTLYKKAARMASNLGETDKVQRFSDQAESFLRKAKKK